MAGRFRNFIESVVFSGMKTGAGESQDPLYISNRSFGRKLKLAAWVVIPCLLVLGFTMVALMGVGQRAATPPETKPEVPAAPAAAAVLPTQPPPDADPPKSETRDPVELVEFRVNQSALVLQGTVRNTTDHAIGSTTIVFELANSVGSQLGRVSALVENLAPKSTKAFRVPIQSRVAAIALVREIRTQ